MSNQFSSDDLKRRFGKEVKEQFMFLELKNFVCVLEKSGLVRYESTKSKSAIEIFYDDRSCEMSLRLMESPGSPSYSMSELLRIIGGVEGGDSYRDPASSVIEGIVTGVSVLATHFRKFVETANVDDTGCFTFLAKSRKDWAEAYAVETQVQQARSRLDSAWKAKDFGLVIEILEPLKEHISLTESKKLEFAKSRKSQKGTL